MWLFVRTDVHFCNRLGTRNHGHSSRLFYRLYQISRTFCTFLTDSVPHEIQKVEELIKQFRLWLTMPWGIPSTCIESWKSDILGTAQKPDIYFEPVKQPIHSTMSSEIVEDYLNKLAEITGRKYGLFDITAIGSWPCHYRHEFRWKLSHEGVITAWERWKVGLVSVHCRPFSTGSPFRITKNSETYLCTDRTKEPGANGEPLYLDVKNALQNWKSAACSRWSLWTFIKDLPAQVLAVYKN